MSQDGPSAATLPRVKGLARAPFWGGRLALGFVLAAGLVGAACTKATLGRQELQESLTRHYLDLRWGRVASAARFMRPDLQAEFVRTWEARLQDFSVNDFEVTHIVDTPDGEGAEVYIEVSLIDQKDLTLKRRKWVQTWFKSETGWRAAELLPGLE